MKSPKLKELGNNASGTDPFRSAAHQVQIESASIAKKSYTLTQAHIDYINTLAKEMATASNSPIVSASAAVRRIVDEHKRLSQ